jgi:predicted metalloprotease
MKINPKARIDRGRVRVRRGGGRTGGFPMPGGGSGGRSGLPVPAGGGVVGIVLVVVLFIVLAKSENCKLNLFVSAIERFWDEELPKQAGVEYSDAQLQIFSGSTSSGCGAASSAMGPFYCPADKYVYIDSTFFDDMLEQDLGAEGGDFAEAYVVAHEYGHHVQDLLGTMAKAQSRETGPTSPSVRLELQADCYAGVWAHFATTVEDENGEVFITDITDDDIRRAIDAATAVGDDRIQEASGGDVDPESWTHGSAKSRVQWFMTGYREGTLEACDTFAADAL